MRITKRQLRRIIKEEKAKLLAEQKIRRTVRRKLLETAMGQGGLTPSGQKAPGPRMISVEWDTDGPGTPPPSEIELHQDAVDDYNNLVATEGQNEADRVMSDYLSDETGWLVLGWSWK